MTQPLASPRIDIVIDSNAAKHGAHEVNAALQSIVHNAALVNAGLNGVAGQFIKTGNSAQNAAKKLKNANDNAHGLGGVLGRLTGFARGAGGALGDLATSFSGLGGLAVAGGMAAIGAAIVGVGVAVTHATAQVQTYKASLTTIIGDTMKAGQAFDALADFAQRTPFTLDEAVNGFVKLSALGLTPSEAAMTSYGNTAAALGGTLEQMVEAVADATTGEFERLKTFGIKSKNEGESIKFTFQGVTTQVGNNSKEIQDYLIAIGETQFAGGMDRQAATIGGAMAALGDQIFLAFNKIGEGAFGTAIAKIINSIADGLAAVTPLLSGIGNVVGSVINVIAEIGSGIGALWNSLTGGGKDSLSLLDSLTIAFQLVGQYVGIVGDLIGAAFRGVANVISWVTDTITSAFGDAWTWLTGSTTDVSGKIGLSFVGVLRAVKYVAKSIPELFSIAFEDIKKMFSGLGDIVGRLLTGDISALDDIGTVFTASFADSAKKMGDIVAKAGEIANDQQGAQAAVDRMLGRSDKKSIDDFAKPGPAGKPTASTTPDKSAEAAAKAEAERLKRIQEYWKTLDETVALSKMLPIEAEKHSKFLELQKLYGDKLSDQDKLALAAAKTKIADKLHEIALNKSLVGMTDDAVKFENANLVNAHKRLGLTEAEASIQDALAEHRIEALNSGATLADLASEAWKTEEKRLETALKTKAAMDGQAAAVAHAKDIAASYSPQADRAQRLSTITADRAQFLQGADKAGISKAIQTSVIRGMDAAIDDIKLESVREFSDSIHALADEFGGAFGKTIKSLGKAMDRLVAGAAGDLDNAGPLGSISKLLGGDVADGFQEGSKSLMKDLGATLGKTFGVSGDMAKSLGKTLGKMGGGAEIGSVVGNAASMVGIKTSGTGSQLGGAAGSLIGGPIGAAIGGLLGGVVGGLFKKAKWATGQIDLVGGNLATGSVSGNKAAYKENAGVASGAVGSSIQEIADALGAVISGDPNVSIGQYKGAWRVSSTGRTGKLKGKYSDVSDFGDDSEAAIAYAAQLSVQQGVLSGLSDFADKILKGSNDDNFASMLTLATQWEGILDEMAATADPLGASIDKVTSSIDKMRTQMVAAGATSADLATLEKYRGQQLQKIVDDQTASLRDLQKTLNGEGSGKTSFALLQDSLAEYSKLQADLKAGVAVDNDDLVSAAQDVLSRAGSTYGTATSQYQNIVSMLKADTANAISSTEARVQASQDAATKAQAEFLEEQRLGNLEASKQTAYLAQIAAAVTATGGSATSMWKYVNGSAQGSMA